MKFRLIHNNSLIRKEKFIAEYNYKDIKFIVSKTSPIVDKSLLSSITDLYPDERLDPLITSLPVSDRIPPDFFDEYEDEEDEEEEYEYEDDYGGLPDDLTTTELLLTRFLWGEVDMFLTILLVAAVEDMSLEEVSNSLKKMNMF